MQGTERLKLETTGFLVLDDFNIPIIPQSFAELDKQYPNGEFADSADEFDICATPHDLEVYAAINEIVRLKLNEKLPGSHWKYHFTGYGVNPDITVMHNDHCSAFPGHNLTANLFYSDTVDNEGIFRIKRDGSIFTHEIRHNVGRLIVFNQNKHFKHMVTPSKKLRKVISFAGFYPELETKYD